MRPWVPTNGYPRQMGVWADQVLPRLTDRSLRSHHIGRLREQACAGLRGAVLEVGFGSGLNVRWHPSTVHRVDAVEPSEVAWELSRRRRQDSPVTIARAGLDGQRLAADDASYDAVLSTFTLCTIPGLDRALAEFRRVLRPDGAVHFLEHGLAPDPEVVAWQHRLEPLQRRLAGGCHLTRDVPERLGAAGFTLDRLETRYLDGPAVSRAWTYVGLGRAVPG